MLDAVRKVSGGQIDGGSAVVADPDADLRRILGEGLASVGCAVRGAEDGIEALEAMGRGTTTIVILNLVLPRMDAVAVIAQMRAVEALRDLPVVVLVPADLSAGDIDRLSATVQRIVQFAPGPSRKISDMIIDQVVGDGVSSPA
jgi:CheY-like chemotaxis protein